MAEDTNQDQPAFHAGFPNAAADAADVPLDLNQLVVKHPASTFYMRVDNNSWEDLEIHQGDIAVIDRSLEPKANDLAVIIDGGGFSLMKIPTEKSVSDEEISVWGVVIWVIQQRKRGGK